MQVDTSGLGAARVHGDIDALRRVLRNLGENAARHASSQIAIAVAERGGDVLLTVDDDGPGIPESERARVLERFVRLDEARSRDEVAVAWVWPSSTRSCAHTVAQYRFRGRRSVARASRSHCLPKPADEHSGCCQVVARQSWNHELTKNRNRSSGGRSGGGDRDRYRGGPTR